MAGNKESHISNCVWEKRNQNGGFQGQDGRDEEWESFPG